MMRTLIFLAVSIAVSATAQAAERNVVVAPGAAPATPSPAKQVDPRAASAADRLMLLSGASGQMESMSTQIIDALMPMLVKGNSGHEQVIRGILREEFVSIMAGMAPDLLAQSRQAYLDHFSADELEAMVRFYETPVGQKMTREMPAIMREMFVFGQQAGRAAVAGAMPRIIARMRAANLAVPTGT